ncbi:MAG: HEPN domain-containing protein [Treponema sp.]|nr:HEPN domain-containing protein [Treponema sp.]
MEKVLKGVLVLNNLTPPKVHDLEGLFNLCKPYVTGIDVLWEACRKINKYSVEPRYPNARETTDSEMRSALQYTAQVMDFLRPLYSKEGDAGQGKTAAAAAA